MNKKIKDLMKKAKQIVEKTEDIILTPINDIENVTIKSVLLDKNVFKYLSTNDSIYPFIALFNEESADEALSFKFNEMDVFQRRYKEDGLEDSRRVTIFTNNENLIFIQYDV